jgi:hypothetical protein
MVMAYFKVLYYNSFGESQEAHENLSHDNWQPKQESNLVLLEWYYYVILLDWITRSRFVCNV